ncbi:chloride channel protein [Demetria terragena]|uniref:chloride channel protein n=1 Tax=Demetria terragena TaxID=63959 RepID=UPI000375AD19|nr:chloride channel protein [Demetria terragena]
MEREPGYARVLAGSVLVGVVAGLGTLVFLLIEHALQHLVWGEREEPGVTWGSGEWVYVPIALVAFAVAGILRKLWKLDGPDPNFVEEMVSGHAPLRESLQRGVLALASLVGGGSVGPEAPVAGLGAGVGHETARRMKLDDEHSKDLTFAGVSGVFGALASFPFAAPIIAMETHAGKRFGSYGRLIPGLVAGVVALGVLYPLIGTPLLKVYDVGGQEGLKAWWLLVAAGLGVVAALLGLALTAAYGAIAALGARIKDPRVRAIAAGAIVAAMGVALPLTMFSGREELAPIVAGEAAVGVVAAAMLLKVLTLTVSMRWGGFGGAIFPLLFIGGASGVLVHEVIPSIPMVVAVPAMAAAVTSMMTPLPLMIVILVTLLFDLRIDVAAVPATAIVTAFIVVHATGLKQKVLGEG